MSLRRAILLVGVSTVACGGTGGETGIDLVIRYQPDLGLDRFALTATAGGEALVERTLLPDGDRPLSEAGREGVLVLLPDQLPGGEVAIRVDGLARGDVVASGQVAVQIAPGELVSAEVMVRPAAAGCSEWDWAPSNLVPCEDGPAPDGALVLDQAGTWRLDTGDGRLLSPDGDTLAPASELTPQSGGQSVRTLAVDQLVVEAGVVLEVVGPHPLVALVWGEATIAGDIDVAAGGGRDEDCMAAGAGGDAGDGESGAGGGGGGAFAGDGGDGGDGRGGEKGMKGEKGKVSGDPGLAPLRGGCPGAAGGDSFGAAGSGGAGGRGGGALHIAARDNLVLGGTVRAAGAGGGGGTAASGSGAGGGGGGSGGSILLEAAIIRLGSGASVCANGGSGGEGSGDADDGGAGDAGTCSEERAASSDQASDGGDGGRGSAGDDTAGENGHAGEGAGAGGGGGGGIGRIRLRATGDLIDLGALVTPEAR